MVIILKGIDLPKEKVETIEVIFRCEEDGSLYSIRELLEPTEAIQIPKGARLIDANAIYIGRWDIDTDLADQIRNAPTILESEVMPDE